MCALRYCSSPAAGFIRSKLQSKIISGASLACSAWSSSTEMRVVYMDRRRAIGQMASDYRVRGRSMRGAPASVSVLFGRRVRRGARAQHGGGDAAGHDQGHAGPAGQRDLVAEQPARCRARRTRCPNTAGWRPPASRPGCRRGSCTVARATPARPTGSSHSACCQSQGETPATSHPGAAGHGGARRRNRRRCARRARRACPAPSPACRRRRPSGPTSGPPGRRTPGSARWWGAASAPRRRSRPAR